MNKLISIVLLSLMPAFCLASQQARPMNLEEGSEFSINLNYPGLLENEKVEWRQDGPDFTKECTLSIRSYFDKELAQKLGIVKYSFNQIQGGTSFYYDNGETRDQISLWMPTQNKDLPLMHLDCFWATRGRKPAEVEYMTLQTVADFIHQPAFFLNPVLNPVKQKPAYHFLPPGTLGFVDVDLEFSGVNNGKYTTITSPKIKNGKIVAADTPGPSCHLSYGSNATDGKSYNVIVKKGTLLKLIGVNESKWGTYIFYLEDAKMARINIDCWWRDTANPDWEDFAQHLNGVITIR